MKKNNYEIKYVPETLNCDGHYQVLKGKEFIVCYDKREQAEKYVDDIKHTVIIRTKKIESYFRGVMMKGYFPIHGHKWFVSCTSYSGGKAPILNVLDFKADSEVKLLGMLRKFKNKHNLKLERSPK